MSEEQRIALVVGGGPAGLRAAEVTASSGARITVCDAQRSVGRKFLVAGRGGLNLTHGEAVANFPARYHNEQPRWQDLLQGFGPTELRAWASELGVETYVGTSGRVFPRGQKAAGLLRAWMRRLRANGVQFRMGARLVRVTPSRDGWQTVFEIDGKEVALDARAIVLALGGASWPETGSNGAWPSLLVDHGIEIAGWQPANCGWEVAWPTELLAQAEGLPLKNLVVRAGGESVSGELLITRHGLEGGAIYRLGPVLRGMKTPQIEIDFKPQLTIEAMRARLENIPNEHDWLRALKLSPAVIALLKTIRPGTVRDQRLLLERVKSFVLPLIRPRPIAEAISSAGGVRWSELDDNLMLRKMPGVFVAGEMIDWEAPTGGYLLQGCFSTGTRAGLGASRYLREADSYHDS